MDPKFKQARLEMSFAARAAEYQRLCARADVFWHDRDATRGPRTSSVPVRLADAREAVLLRSEGHCENPRSALSRAQPHHRPVRRRALVSSVTLSPAS